MKIPDLEQKATQVLLNCLRDIPFLQVNEPVDPRLHVSGNLDILTHLKIPGADLPLVAVVKSSGQPRIARDAVNNLIRARQYLPGAYGVFIAPYISPEAAEICTREGIGYADLAGNCRLAFDLVYIRKEGAPNPFGQKRELRSLYSPKAERVLRVLLATPGRKWKTQVLADEAQVSLGQIANVKKMLEDCAWLQPGPEGFWLSQPEALLGEWAENYRYSRNRIQEFYTLQSMAEIEAGVATVATEEGTKYALTAFSGAARLAPHVRYQRATVYVREGIDKITKQLKLKEVSTGANVHLLTPYDDGVFYGTQPVDGINIATPVQTYLDLRQMKARGEEAAEALLEEVIRPKW